MNKISMIVACDRHWSIAKQGKIPWHLPDDLRFFKETTMNHVLIMGRKTYNSLPKSLTGRTIAVLSRNLFRIVTDDSVETYSPKNLIETLHFLTKSYKTKNKKIFIAGGEEIYSQAMEFNIADRIIMTNVHGIFRGDKHFPALKGNWDKKLLQSNPNFDIFEYTRQG